MAVTDTAAYRAEKTPVYPRRSAVISWIFFDWAAQPYFTLITTFVFAPYFANFVAPNPATGQALWGFAAASAGAHFTPGRAGCETAEACFGR